MPAEEVPAQNAVPTAPQTVDNKWLENSRRFYLCGSGRAFGPPWLQQWPRNPSQAAAGRASCKPTSPLFSLSPPLGIIHSKHPLILLKHTRLPSFSLPSSTFLNNSQKGHVIFYSRKPPTSPPRHTLMHTFSHAHKYQQHVGFSTPNMNQLGSWEGGVSHSVNLVTQTRKHTEQWAWTISTLMG